MAAMMRSPSSGSASISRRKSSLANRYSRHAAMVSAAAGYVSLKSTDSPNVSPARTWRMVAMRPSRKTLRTFTEPSASR